MHPFLSHIPLGASLLGGDRCRFRVWAPHAGRVEVRIGSPEPRVQTLDAASGGYHQGILHGVPANSRYHYRLYPKDRQNTGKGYVDRADPASRFQPEGVQGPSQVVPAHFEWSDAAWAGISLRHYILYELHVGTFTPKGTFDAVIPRLAELKDLGITAIEIMPVAQFPGARNWGYDGAYPFAVQNTYGGPRGLKRLVDACHRTGLAVVLDVVYNHLGPEGNFLRDFGPYFTRAYHTPWGEAVNLDGAGSDSVREFFLQNARQWVGEFHMDALRIDAVHAIYDFSAQPFLEELGCAIHELAERENRRIYLIAESALNDNRTTRSRELGGLGLDAQWNDDFHHALHTLLTGETRGYYRDFGRVDDVARAWEDGFVYAGQYSAFRERRHGNSSHNIPACRLVVFAQNHDQVGNRMNGERLSTLISFDKQKLAAAAVLLSPFIPLLFMGEAYGETAPFPYFVSHSDDELIQAVRAGRKREFAGFDWEGEPPDPQSEVTFQRAILDPAGAGSENQQVLRRFYKELIRLRKQIPALAQLSKRTMEVSSLEKTQTLCVHRWGPGDDIFIIFQFGDRPRVVDIPLPEGRWRRVLDSGTGEWLGPGNDIPAEIRSAPQASVTVLPAPHSAVLFQKMTEGIG